MNRILLFIILFFTSSSISQISLEHTYIGSQNNLYMVDLELSGMKYIRVSRSENERKIQLYNLDHSIWKTIDCNSFPHQLIPSFDPITGEMDTTYSYEFDVLYVSENLFDLDPQLEFMFCISNSGFSPSYTGIYNEDGAAVFAEFDVLPTCRLNIPQQFRPIYNTPNGTKMILSSDQGDSKVYSLAGTLQLNVVNNSVTSTTNMTIYPNPSVAGITTINYELPDAVTEASVVVTDINGNKIKTMRIDKAFKNVNLDNSEFSSGVYLYNLIVDGVTIESKKIIIEQ